MQEKHNIDNRNHILCKKNIILTTGIIYFVRKTDTVRIPNINNGLYYLCIPQIHVLKITSLRQRLDPRYSPNLIQPTGADPEGGAPGARPPPPKIGKNMIFWHKIVIFHTKYPKNFRTSLRSVQFFNYAPP